MTAKLAFDLYHVHGLPLCYVLQRLQLIGREFAWEEFVAEAKRAQWSASKIVAYIEDQTLGVVAPADVPKILARVRAVLT